MVANYHLESPFMIVGWNFVLLDFSLASIFLEIAFLFGNCQNDETFVLSVRKVVGTIQVSESYLFLADLLILNANIFYNP